MRRGHAGHARDLLPAALRGGRGEQAGGLVAERALRPEAARRVLHGLQSGLDPYIHYHQQLTTGNLYPHGH